MGVDNFVRVNLACSKMIKTVLIISAVIVCINADIYTATRTFKAKVGKKQKVTTCEFEISYNGDGVLKAGTSVDCSYENENKKNYSKIKFPGSYRPCFLVRYFYHK